MEWIKKLRQKAVKTEVVEEEEEDDGLETVDEKRRRWRSVRVIYFTMFLMSLGFSVVLSGVWPFLDKLDPKAGKEFMGYVVAANPLGQIIFSLGVGYWSNKSGSIRQPLLFTIVLFVIANGIYASLEVFESHNKYWMLWSRFVVGASSANIAAARSYLSAATRVKERTGAVSMVSLAQVLGFVVGPIFQAAVTPLGETGLPIYGELRLNMFTATGWINVVLGIFNFVLFLPFCFKEHKIAAKEVMKCRGMGTEKEAWKSIKPDKLGCWTLIIAFFILVFNFVLVETLGTPLTMDQFAWSKTESLYYMGIIMGVGAMVACVVFAFTSRMAKLFDERKLMLWGGFLITGMASVFLLPWGSEPPQLAIPKNLTIEEIKNIAAGWNLTDYTLEELVSNLTQSGDDLLGCPVSQKWCFYTPALTVTQLCISYICASIGYPLGVTLIQTILSKLLGPRPQGVWMGLMTSSGCFSRMMGPVFVGYVYTRLGPIWTFSSTISMMVVSMVWIHFISHRLQPPAIKENSGTELTNLKVSKPDENGFSDRSKLYDSGKSVSNGNMKENLEEYR